MSGRAHRGFRERLFALTLYLYPRRFRDEFGEPMLQTLRDRCRDRRESGIVSAVRELALLLSDTLRSAAAEHVQVYRETRDMKPIHLGVLLIAATVIAYHRDDIGTNLLDRLHANVSSHYQMSLDEYARHVGDFEAAIATQLANSGDARSQLIAAQFFAARVPKYGYSTIAAGDTAIARQSDADAAFSRALALGWSDPIVLWAAAVNCPATPGVCRSPESLRRLTEVDPANALAWRLEFNAAIQSNDSARARDALGHMAAATKVANFEGEMIGLWLDAYALSPVPAALISRYQFPDAVSEIEVVSGRIDDRMYAHRLPGMLYYSALSNLCLGSSGTDAILKHDCLAVSRLMAASQEYFQKFEGTRLSALLASTDSQRAAIEHDWRPYAWQRMHYSCVVRPSCDELASIDDARLTRWMTLRRKDGSEMLALEDALRAEQIALSPPDSWPVTTDFR